MSGTVPLAAAPMHSRRTSELLPSPGRESSPTLGLDSSRARVNQDSGSKQTVCPVSRCRPRGVPIGGEPEPTANGHSPQACTVVARHSGGAST